MMHPNTFVAQTVASIPNHFYKSILDAASFNGPALVNTYNTCQPEHGVGDDMSRNQSKLAVESRTFPVFRYDPRNGNTIRERLDLQGNPAQAKDWYTVAKTNEVVDFVSFARTEGRFAKQFDADGNPSETLLAGQADRLSNWRLLQEMAGVLDLNGAAMPASSGPAATSEAAPAAKTATLPPGMARKPKRPPGVG